MRNIQDFRYDKIMDFLEFNGYDVNNFEKIGNKKHIVIHQHSSRNTLLLDPKGYYNTRNGIDEIWVKLLINHFGLISMEQWFVNELGKDFKNTIDEIIIEDYLTFDLTNEIYFIGHFIIYLEDKSVLIYHDIIDILSHFPKYYSLWVVKLFKRLEKLNYKHGGGLPLYIWEALEENL